MRRRRRMRRMNCRIDRVFLVGVVLDGVVAGGREGIGMIRYLT